MGEQRFSVIPVRAVTDKSMPASVFRTLSALGLFTDKNGWCYPSLRALSEVLGISRSAVSRHIKWLAEHGYVNVAPQYNADGSRGANLIQVRFDYPPEDTPETLSEEEEEDEPPEPPAEAPPEANGNGFPKPSEPDQLFPEETPTEEAPAAEPVGRGVFHPAQQGVSPSATGVALKGATGVALKSATGVALKGATLTPQLTSQLTPQLTQRVKTTTTNARARPRDAAVAVVAVADLPAEVRQTLRNLGWVGDAAEIARAWAENPNRVRAWLDHALRHGWRAALLRYTLRTDPGMPPQERPLAGWEAFAENIADAGPVTDGALAETEQEVPAPQPPDQIPPNVGTPPPVPENATPDMGVEPPVPPPRAPDIGSDAASVPPDVRRWWQTAVGQLRYEMPKASFDTWVAPARPVKWRDGDGEAVLTVGVANDYARRWLEERVAKVLSRYVSALAGRPVTLEVTVG